MSKEWKIALGIVTALLMPCIICLCIPPIVNLYYSKTSEKGATNICPPLPKGFSESDLVDFDGNGRYGDPKLVWINTAGPTAVKFLDSNKLGDKYENNMFVADVHNGRIYHFDLTPDRNDIILPKVLSSRVIENPSSPGVSDILFGDRFGGITDLEVGPDGNLYVVSIGLGSIFQISPVS